jgi:hypothetical protein
MRSDDEEGLVSDEDDEEKTSPTISGTNERRPGSSILTWKCGYDDVKEDVGLHQRKSAVSLGRARLGRVMVRSLLSLPLLGKPH